MRPLRTLVAAAAAAALAGVLFWPAGARAQDAATISEVGWWSRNPAAAPPSGGFQVARAPDGDLSVAALRVQVASPPTAARLLLQQAQAVGTPTMQVCKTTATWSAAAHSDPPPERDCASAIPLQPDTAAGGFAADVVALLGGGGEVSLMIVPMPDSANPSPIQTPFQADFTGATLSASGGDEGTTSAGVGSGDTGGGVATGELGSAPTDVSFSATPTAGADLAISPVVAPPDLNPAVAPAAAAPAQVPGRFPVRATAASGTPRPWGRLPLLIVTAAAIGAGAAFARQRLRTLGWLPSQ